MILIKAWTYPPNGVLHILLLLIIVDGKLKGCPLCVSVIAVIICLFLVAINSKESGILAVPSAWLISL
jgi:hypothetical protein